MQDNRIDYLYEIVTPLATSLGLELWGIDVLRAGRLIVKIFVETKQSDPATGTEPVTGINIDQCAELSRLVGLSLDVEDVLDNWILEVSSPGLDRTFFALEQMTKFIGQEININLMASPEGYSELSSALGRKKFQGLLTAVMAEDFTLKLPKSLRHEGEPEEITLPWQLVRQARLVANFPEVVKPGKKPKQKHMDYLD